MARKDLIQKRIVNSAGIATTVYVRPDGGQGPSPTLISSAMPSSSNTILSSEPAIVGRYETLSGIADDIRDEHLYQSVRDTLRDSGGTDHEYLTAVRDKLEVLRETEVASDSDSDALDDLDSEIELLLRDTPYSESITGGATSADCEWVRDKNDGKLYLTSPNSEEDGAFALVLSQGGKSILLVQPGGSAHGHSMDADVDGKALELSWEWNSAYSNEDEAREAAEEYVDRISAMDVNSDEFIDYVTRNDRGKTNGALVSVIGRGAALNNVDIYRHNHNYTGVEFDSLLRENHYDEAATLARNCGFSRLADRIDSRKF